MINGGRIQKAIFPEGKISVQMEEESGQVFVYPFSPIHKHTTLSVITDNGYVQDLEIQFEDRSAEVVILNEPNSEIDEEQKCGNKTKNISCFISQILQGKIPQGYVAIEEKGKERTIGCVSAIHLTRFEGDMETIHLYLIKNNSLKDTSFHERFLNISADWIYLAKNHLNPKEETFALISTMRPN